LQEAFAMIVRVAGPFAAFVVGSILSTVGFMVAFWLGKPIRDEALASSSWPTAKGRIIRSVLEERRDEGKRQVSADVGYEYELGGNTITGSRVWIGDDYWASPGGEFIAAVERYPVGREVAVHYDPLNNAGSVLEPGATWSSSLAYVIGLSLLGAGSLLLLSALLPLLLVIVAIVGWSAPKRGDDMRDFDRGPPQPLRGGRDTKSDRAGDGDDGITIG
jgi:hypothetical protein